MIIGETPTISFEIPEEWNINLNDATEIVIKYSNDNNFSKEHKLTLAAPYQVEVDGGNNLVARCYMQKSDSDQLKPGRIQLQMEIKLPASIYPNFPAGMFVVGQSVQPVLKRI